MALFAEIIPFTLRTGTGVQTIAHVQNPTEAAKAVMFVGAQATGDYRYQYGLDDGVTHLGNSVAFNETFGVALSARGQSTLYSLISVHAQVFFGGVSTHLLGYVSALNVGSFDITLDLNAFAGSSWLAIIIGGDGVECATGLYDFNSGSPGTVNVGFDPLALFHIGVPDAGTGDGQLAGARASYGFATVCNTNKQVGWGIEGESSVSNYTSYQLATKIQADISASSTTVSDEVTVAFATNGQTYTFSGNPNWNFGYLAVGGSAVSANLVQIIQPTTTGVQNVTIDSTDPVIAFFASTDKVATSGAGNFDANLSFGAYDRTSTMSQWLGAPNGTTSPYKRGRIASMTNAITMATATGVGTQTVNATATVALTSTNIAVNWTAADATQREVWALVLSKNLTGGSSPCGINPQASITVLKQCTPIAGGETEFPFGTTGGLSPSTFTLMDGESQLFSGISTGTYGVTESAPSGWTASYAVSNGDSHSAITVTGTEAITVTVTNTFRTSTPTFRIYRRFALPYDEHYFTYLNRLEIVAQMGVGNSSAPNPIIKIRFSKDGGSTFGDFRTMSLGAATQYTKRAYINRVGRGRDLVAELICDDPVVVAWVQCLVEGEKATGTN